MMLLNLGCGGNRPGPPFVNVDTLLAEHRFAGPECDQLRSEANYVEFNIAGTVTPVNQYASTWPWQSDSVDGILASHVIEHFDCITALQIFRECHRVLKPGGVLRVSVPDAAYFREVYHEDNRDTAQRLFGQPLYEKDTMMDYALFFIGHKQIFSEHSLWCHFANGGFTPATITKGEAKSSQFQGEAANMLASQDNRLQMSLFMEAVK